MDEAASAGSRVVEQMMHSVVTVSVKCVQSCFYQWTETQCLSCSRWSAHSDWYAHS
jgi:hypothetical protein